MLNSIFDYLLNTSSNVSTLSSRGVAARESAASPTRLRQTRYEMRSFNQSTYPLQEAFFHAPLLLEMLQYLASLAHGDALRDAVVHQGPEIKASEGAVAVLHRIHRRVSIFLALRCGVHGVCGIV
jgi:hypothetical protein